MISRLYALFFVEFIYRTYYYSYFIEGNSTIPRKINIVNLIQPVPSINKIFLEMF